MTFTGIFVPGLNRATYLANPQCRVETFFMTPELRIAGPKVDFLPLCYADILGRLRRSPPQAALFSVTPPDASGWCSFGTVVDFLAEIWAEIPVRIAHVNPLMPRTRGHKGIPWSALTAVIEDGGFEPLCAPDTVDDISTAIARHVAPIVEDGATIETGLGRVPGALMHALRDHRRLRIHSGLIGEGVVDLLEAGALAEGAAVTGGVAIGSPRLYAAVAGPAFNFLPVSCTHAARVIGEIPRFTAVNSALEVDLFGQAYSELTPKGWLSGPGGASDFARGRRLSQGGVSIVALPALAGQASRIVAPGEAKGPISLGRFDIDVVVTEHGAADLRGLDHDARAEALTAIAAPMHRDRLARDWSAFSRRL